MSALKSVVTVITHTTTEQKVLKTKVGGQQSYGHTRTEVTTLTTIEERPVALLSCGHWRTNYGDGADVRTAKKLACHVCDEEKRKRGLIAAGKEPPEWMDGKHYFPNDGTLDDKIPEDFEATS